MSRYKLSVSDVQALQRMLPPLGKVCGAPHPYMRFGDGTNPNAERWTCTRELGHEGRCAMGPISWPEPEWTPKPMKIPEEEPLPLPTFREQHVARVLRLHEVYLRDLFMAMGFAPAIPKNSGADEGQL